MKASLFRTAGLLWSLVWAVDAHGYHPKASELEPDPDWATMHMAVAETGSSYGSANIHDSLLEEHHIDNFDPSSFFTLHDFNSDGHWDDSEVRLFYGLDSPLNQQDPKHATTEDHKLHAIRDVFALFDPEGTGMITKSQWMEHYDEGRRLPDFGLGPGHHGDDEYEYEIHHFERFHGDDTREEDLTHPEDIEHFKMHDRLEEDLERVAKLEREKGIVQANIPAKFRKQG